MVLSNSLSFTFFPFSKYIIKDIVMYKGRRTCFSECKNKTWFGTLTHRPGHEFRGKGPFLIKGLYLTGDGLRVTDFDTVLKGTVE